MELFGYELTVFQISLIVALLVIAPLGYYNQRKRAKEKKEEEELFTQGYQNNSDESSINENDEESQQIITYISSYKDSYPKDAIRTALINNGNSQDKVDSLLEKYY